MKLYGYWRSSATWRVRLALSLKGLPFEIVPINLIKDGGEQHSAEHRQRNAFGQVPVLEIDGHFLTQSMAILEYLEEVYPSPPLLPATPRDRAQTRMLAEIVNSGIQPVQNLHVLQKLKAAGQDEAAWANYFIARGLDALEAAAAHSAGTYLVGDSPTFADIYLMPQLYNARRFSLDVARWPTLARAEKSCEGNPAFAAAHPDRQPDAPKSES